MAVSYRTKGNVHSKLSKDQSFMSLVYQTDHTFIIEALNYEIGFLIVFNGTEKDAYCKTIKHLISEERLPSA